MNTENLLEELEKADRAFAGFKINAADAPVIQAPTDMGLEYHKEAAISTVLEDKMSPSGPSGCRPKKIRVVGAELRNLTDEYEHRETWENLLTGWLKGGSEVSYAVVGEGINNDAVEFFRVLSESFPHRFHVYLLNEGSDSEDVKEMVEVHREFHFLISNSPNLLWIEKNHPEGSGKAYDCEFYGEKGVRNFPSVYQMFDKRFDDLVDLGEKIC